MEFINRKLPREAIHYLYAVPVAQIRAFSILMGPVYLYFKENEKFIAIKTPLDFFTDQELTHFLPFEYFYFHRAMLHALTFREAGKNLRTLLTWKKPVASYQDVLLTPSSFEISAMALKMMGPLWWNYPHYGAGVEPFLLIGFMSELCDRLSAEKLGSIRDKQIYRSETALLRSSTMVYFALLLGYGDLKFLNRLRDEVFDRTLRDDLYSDQDTEIEELFQLIRLCLDTFRDRMIPVKFFYERTERVAHKIHHRLLRIEREHLNRGCNPPTFFGERGFMNES